MNNINDRFELQKMNQFFLLCENFITLRYEYLILFAQAELCGDKK